MKQIAIRDATSADLPVLVHHRRMMWWDMGHHDEAALALMRAAACEYFQAALADGSYRGFLAMNPAHHVIGGGGIVISPWPGTLGQRRPHRAMILNMYVEAAYRRQGVARTLMARMIEWCRDNGFAHVGLHASEQGRPLYEQFGFKPTNEMTLQLK